MVRWCPPEASGLALRVFIDRQPKSSARVHWIFCLATHRNLHVQQDMNQGCFQGGLGDLLKAFKTTKEDSKKGKRVLNRFLRPP